MWSLFHCNMIWMYIIGGLPRHCHRLRDDVTAPVWWVSLRQAKRQPAVKVNRIINIDIVLVNRLTLDPYLILISTSLPCHQNIYLRADFKGCLYLLVKFLHWLSASSEGVSQNRCLYCNSVQFTHIARTHRAAPYNYDPPLSWTFLLKGHLAACNHSMFWSPYWLGQPCWFSVVSLLNKARWVECIELQHGYNGLQPNTV